MATGDVMAAPLPLGRSFGLMFRLTEEGKEEEGDINVEDLGLTLLDCLLEFHGDVRLLLREAVGEIRPGDSPLVANGLGSIAGKSYGSCVLVVMLEPCGNLDSTHNFLK